MSNKIKIEYCQQSGFATPALKLKSALKKEFDDVEIVSQPSGKQTGRIQVSWVGDKTQVVWSKNKTDTENGHEQIVSNLRQFK